MNRMHFWRAVLIFDRLSVPKEGLHKCSPKMLAEYRRGCDDLIDETN